MTLDEFNRIKKLHKDLCLVNDLIKAYATEHKTVRVQVTVKAGSVVTPETYYLDNIDHIFKEVLKAQKEHLETTLLELGLEV